MRGMYKFIKEVANRLTEELGDKADADVDFELKVFLLQFNYTKLLLPNMNTLKLILMW